MTKYRRKTANAKERDRMKQVIMTIMMIMMVMMVTMMLMMLMLLMTMMGMMMGNKYQRKTQMQKREIG